MDQAGVAPHVSSLLESLRVLQERLQAGGGLQKIEKQHQAGKLTARERIRILMDSDSRFFEIGLLLALNKYEGNAPAAGVVTGVGRIEGRVAVVVANDATVKAGAWWPETIAKILRAQEVAMRNRVPIVYLVDSAGVNLPLQDGVFPGQYGAARIFYYNSLMRRKLRVPQIAAVMGPCIAGGAYLPALSDVIVMVDGTSFMGLGGPNLVRGATGEVVDSERLGGARLHTQTSGVAHYRAANDEECLHLIRRQFMAFPPPPPQPCGQAPARPESGLLTLLPEDHRLPNNVGAMLEAVFDAGSLLEFQPEYAPEMLCVDANLEGRPVAVLANRRGFLKSPAGPRVGGVIYVESARKAAYFVEKAERQGLPLIYLQDVTGFMVGTAAEADGIIRAGAEMVESMACATVPKIVLTLNHASGAGYYAMAGQGFDPHFTIAWPTARIGVMEGESAVQAIHGPEIEKYRAAGEPLPGELREAIERTQADYERWLDATHAAAQGHVDAIIDPRETRETLAFLLEVALANPHRRQLALEFCE
jgi:3-methylcrotonyl-CoA carboxylase beta subunit